jgi:cysteine desulfurase
MDGYFDMNATTPICGPAEQAMCGALRTFANPSANYRLAKASRSLIADARAAVAGLIGAASDEIVFTSGGTEANNWALKGAADAIQARDPGARLHLIVSAIEHASVLEVAGYLQTCRNVELTLVAPDVEGLVSAQAVVDALRPHTRMVAVMLANNEIGSVQPIAAIAEALRGRGIHLHTDAVQAVGKLPVDAHALGVDTLAFAAHKFRGPKGIGGLYVRDGVELVPLLHGGGQERGQRGGTEALASIAGMGAAAEHVRRGLDADIARMRALREALREALRRTVAGVVFNGPDAEEARLPNTLSVTIPGIRAEALAALLDHGHGIQVSLGAACSNHKQASLSHVLHGIGLCEERIRATLRLSLNAETPDAAIERLCDALRKELSRLDAIANPTRKEMSHAT